MTTLLHGVEDFPPDSCATPYVLSVLERGAPESAPILDWSQPPISLLHSAVVDTAVVQTVERVTVEEGAILSIRWRN
jgi:hypothetical protein